MHRSSHCVQFGQQTNIAVLLLTDMTLFLLNALFFGSPRPFFGTKPISWRKVLSLHGCFESQMLFCLIVLLLSRTCCFIL